MKVYQRCSLKNFPSELSILSGEVRRRATAAFKNHRFKLSAG